MCLSFLRPVGPLARPMGWPALFPFNAAFPYPRCVYAMCVLITAAGATVSWPVNYILNSSSLILMPCATVTTTTTTTARSCALKQIKDSFRTALSLRSLARSLVHLIHLFSYLWTISSVQCPTRETSLNFAFVNVLLVIVKLGFYIANATHALPHSLTHSFSQQIQHLGRSPLLSLFLSN